MCTNEKVKQTFLQHLPVPVQQVVKSFKVVIIIFLTNKARAFIFLLCALCGRQLV